MTTIDQTGQVVDNQIFGLNSSELQSHAIKIVIGALMYVSGHYLPPDLSASVAGDIPSIASAIVAVGVFAYGYYLHNNMKLVPEKSTAVILPAAVPGAAPPPPAPVGAVINLTPLTGLAKVVGALLIGFVLLSLAMSAPAFAQLKPLPALKPLTGDIAKDFSPAAPASPLSPAGKNQLVALWQSLQKASAADITYAIAMATAANKALAPTGVVTAAGMRLSCLTAIQTLNGQIGGTSLVDANNKPLTRPDPALFTDAETFAEVIDAIQPGGPLFTSCSGAAQLAATDTLAFVNALVTGAAGLALVAPK